MMEHFCFVDNEILEVNNNTIYLLEENSKPIKGSFDYQNKSGDGKGTYRLSELEIIRLGVLRKPVSKIVYYGYLGLDYRRKAKEILDTCDNINPESSAEHMRTIRKFSDTVEDRHHFLY